jgi:UDP-N-acetylglucosamine acyltransferase
MNTESRSVISPKARIGNNVEIAPFCVIEDDVVIGDRCRLESNVIIRKGTVVGEGNAFYSGTVIGGPPQHTTALPPYGQVVIGNGNVFRENVTIHKAMKITGTTVIGDDNYLMVNAHIAHDCCVGNNVVLVNNVMLGGHVQIGNRANLGGGAAVHQFCRVGSLTMVGGQAHVIQDVPPFVTVDGLTSRIVGLNLIGLRRGGRTVEEIRTLKSVYRILYRSGLTWLEIIEKLQNEYSIGPGAEMLQFLLGTQRGIVSERRSAGSNSIRLVESEEKDNCEEENIRTLKVSAG